MKTSSYSEEDKYKLYRTVYDIIHPSISKKNISNYKIILDDNIAPIRVFYPNKPTINTSIIIFIPSSIDLIDNDVNYAKICKEISTKTNSIILGIDYNSSSENKYPNGLNECYSVVKYLYNELKNNDVSENNIILMGDSIGSNIITEIINKGRKDKFYINKSILFSLIVDKTDDIEKNKVNVIQLNKFKDFFDNYIDNNEFNYPTNENNFEDYPNTLLFVGAADPLYEKVKKYNDILKKNNVKIELIKITFADHKIIGNNDPDIKDEIYKNINEFLNS